MKGLKEYIRKHGCHFTEQLAGAVTLREWDSSRIMKDSQKRVYYNVTGSTVGDMVYMMDMFCRFLSDQYTYGKGMCLMLDWVGDYDRTGNPFSMWIGYLAYSNKDFDLTPYI